MNEILEKIDKASHIVIISDINPDAGSIGSASAMYSFLLQKHKKVSWFCKTEVVSYRFSFIAWVEKIRDSFPASADLAISLGCGDKKYLGIEPMCDLINIERHFLYDFFKANEVKINKKMATALYAELLYDSDAFLSDEVDGTTFALAKELIECGADFKLCNKNIMKSVSLAALRVKAVMFKNMSLECDARVAVFCLSDEDMRLTGAATEDCEAVLAESLNLIHVEVSLLLKQNSDFTIKGFLRSNSEVDCLKIAANFDGEGHKKRADFDVDSLEQLDDIKNRVLNLIKKEIII
ncbi:MAG: hypothetical protein A2W82_05655 [Sulfurimonas sp. RIFCSPLOWO2_12_36_12]|uniref:DHH family phosphoesterase n=1 Tax=Sulfurimonas sp. RIFCSPLOWO2_12_36_12 TaxID=1802253 RepID=UPI0008CC4A77|nr:phosphoesterase [Sulfurimonas sp. RIFCSPLOWO2_12_36_12]OHE00075.1 MAG: hypothetical protein A2W82_05655 [Sulfurimonas sp. RIFCSPLOWO2_12_36_12]